MTLQQTRGILWLTAKEKKDATKGCNALHSAKLTINFELFMIFYPTF